MLVAVLFIALIDPAAKYAARELPVLQVVWSRYAFAAVTAIILFRPPADPRRWGIQRLPLQLLRAGLLLSATAFNFLALCDRRFHPSFQEGLIPTRKHAAR